MEEVGQLYLIAFYIIQFIALMIHLEIIELNFCGLNKFTKRNIEFRGITELLEDDRDSTAKMSWEVVSATDSIWSWSKVMWDESMWIVHLDQVENYDTELWYALSLIQITVNWTLWILAIVVFVYMLYNWFLVLSAWSDDKNVSKWKKWISNAAIAIAWIGLAWLIISAMIRFIKNITK